MKRFSTAVVCILMWFGLALAADPINLAGTYECNSNPQSVRKQMYLTIDFLNRQVPDFTQVFTTKESSFKLLPKDFMNAKKLKKNFAGQKAPGFGKFKSKFLFSNTYEFKLSNPRVKDGVIIADWEDNNAKKGECTIIAYPDGTLRILGLTSLTRDLSPDNVTLTRVVNALPSGAEPFVTPQAVADFLVNEADKLLVTPKVTPFDKELELKVDGARQIGDRVEIDMKLRNKSNYESLTLTVCQKPNNESFAEDSNGRVFSGASMYAKTPGTLMDHPAIKADKDKWVSFKVIVDNVNGRIDRFNKVGVYFAIAGGFFMDNHIGLIENLPVFQEMPEEIKPGSAAKKVAAETAKSNLQLELPQSKYVLVLGDNVNIRAAAASSAAVVGKAAEKAVLEFIAMEKGWLKVNYPAGSGNAAYISTKVARLVVAPALKLNSTDESTISFYNHTLDKNPTYGFESNTQLNFSGTPDKIIMTVASGVVYMDGRIREYHYQYRGKIENDHVLFTEKKIDEDGDWEKLPVPETVYAGEKEWTLRFDRVVYDAYSYDQETDQDWKLSE